jgi:ankyrin repeat protein
MKTISLAGVAFVILTVLIPSIHVHAGELHDAAIKGDMFKVRQLIEKGADVNVRDKNQDTPLHEAASRRKTDVAKLLIEKGADVNAKDNYGQTALDMAEASHKSDIVSILRAAVIR